MQPADQPDKPKRQLPPELAFLNELTNRPEMENEEYLVWTRGLLQKIRDNAELMRKHDFDPDLMISRLLPNLERLERARRDVEEAEEELLHLIADEADAGRAAVDGLERVIKAAAEEKPFDPQVQELLEDLEEMRTRYPKSD